MAVSLGQFAKNLVRSRLISAEEVAGFQAEISTGGKPVDAEKLARALIQAGKLTKYQVREIAQGHCDSLVMGEYIVLDEIGAGGMGKVLKAQHRRMERIVALKVLAAKLVDSPEAVKRFDREVKAAARLNHPNIVIAFDAGKWQDVRFLVMEYVLGTDLSGVLQDRGLFTVEQAVDCIVQAARGLEYAHQQGVIHRDIKPSNLLLDEKGTVKILDMGLARIEQLGPAAEDKEKLTSTGVTMGTCDYMAPEQAENTHAADHRADIYSLGCTLYRLLTGKPPYQGETPVKVILGHIRDPIPSIRTNRSDVPEELDAVFQKMVAKRPEDRYGSMAAVIEALRASVAPVSDASRVRAERSSSDAALTSFLQGIGQQVARKPLVARHEETERSHAQQNTGVVGRLAEAARGRAVLHLAVAALGMIVVVVLGLLVLNWPRAESDEAGGLNAVEVGEGEVASVPQPVRGSSTTPTPPLAIAPFDAAQAKKHQRAWAAHLKLPVEDTNSIGMKFVLIPPGEFDMGSTPEEIRQVVAEGKQKDNGIEDRDFVSELPRHRVRITRPFYVCRNEVTVGVFRRFVDDAKYRTEPEREGGTVGWIANEQKDDGPDPKYNWQNLGFVQEDTFPVGGVTWNDATQFCGWLSRKEGRTYRLLTDAEWEYSCRAGSVTRWCFGDDELRLSDYAWYLSTATVAAHAVGQKKPNAWGLFDMHGSVHEWCSDWFSADYYTASPLNDPLGPSDGSQRVRRGGCWGGYPWTTRSAGRSAADYSHSVIGFRVARGL